MHRVLTLIVAHEAFESPSSGVFVEVRVLDHHIDSPAVAFEDDSILLSRFAQLVHNDRAISEVAGSITIDCFLIGEDMVHALFALGYRAARQDDAGSNVHPEAEVGWILYGFRSE